MTIEQSTMPEPVGARVVRFILIVTLFVVIGPFIGGLIGWCIAIAFSLARGTAGRASGWHELLPFVMMIAYLIGAPVAAVAGVVHAVAAIWFKKTDVTLPFIAALIAIAAFLFVGLVYEGAGIVLLLIVVVPASFAASFACWRITRGLMSE